MQSPNSDINGKNFQMFDKNQTKMSLLKWGNLKLAFTVSWYLFSMKSDCSFDFVSIEGANKAKEWSKGSNILFILVYQYNVTKETFFKNFLKL